MNSILFRFCCIRIRSLLIIILELNYSYNAILNSQSTHQSAPASQPSTLALSECEPRQNPYPIPQTSQNSGVAGVRFTLPATGQRTKANPNSAPLAITTSTPPLPNQSESWVRSRRLQTYQAVESPALYRVVAHPHPRVRRRRGEFPWNMRTTSWPLGLFHHLLAQPKWGQDSASLLFCRRRRRLRRLPRRFVHNIWSIWFWGLIQATSMRARSIWRRIRRRICVAYDWFIDAGLPRVLDKAVARSRHRPLYLRLERSLSRLSTARAHSTLHQLERSRSDGPGHGSPRRLRIHVPRSCHLSQRHVAKPANFEHVHTVLSQRLRNVKPSKSRQLRQLALFWKFQKFTRRRRGRAFVLQLRRATCLSPRLTESTMCLWPLHRRRSTCTSQNVCT